MLLRRILLLLILAAPVAFAAGCGGVEEGAVEAPSEPEPELTDEEEAAERAYIRESRGE